MRADLRLTLPLVVSLALAACTTTITLGQDDRTYPDGAARIPCGPVACDPGKVCCNAACGVCAALGSCPPTPRACVDAAVPCGPDAVALTGSIVCSSFVWNGVDCVQAYGCTCTGDCGLQRSTYADCMELHAACWSSVCSSGALCPHDYYCRRTTCDVAETGTCARIPTDCSSVTHTATCGCDGVSYRSACDAAHAGQTLLPGAPVCACTAPDLLVTPGCTTSLGWTWDGVRCTEITGCACRSQCDRLEPDEASCRARYESACAMVYGCGGSACARGSEYCDTRVMGGLCFPAPMPCVGMLSCQCLLVQGVDTGGACSEDGAGAVTLSMP